MRSRISKWGNSAAVRIPKESLRAAGLHQGQELMVDAREGVIELRPQLHRVTLAELVAEAKRSVSPPTVDWGPDVGSEIIGDR